MLNNLVEILVKNHQTVMDGLHSRENIKNFKRRLLEIQKTLKYELIFTDHDVRP